MYKYFVLLIIFLGLTPAFADFTTFSNSGNSKFNSRLKMNQPKVTTVRTNQYQRNYNRHYPYYNNRGYLSNSDLSALEKYVLNKTFRRENDLTRLERLENLAFGSSQSGDILSRYQNVESAILSRPKYTAKQGFLGNLASYFSGQATGFTPSLYPNIEHQQSRGFANNPYLFTPSSGYGNNSFENYSNGIFSGGWGHFGQDYGTRSGIRILD